MSIKKKGAYAVGVGEEVVARAEGGHVRGARRAGEECRHRVCGEE